MGRSSLVISLIMSVVLSFERFTFLGWQITRGTLSAQANINRILARSSRWRPIITSIVLLLLKRGMFGGLQSLKLFQFLFGQTLRRRVLVVTWNGGCFIAKEIGPIFAVRSILANAEVWVANLGLNKLNDVERIMNKPISAAQINFSTVDSLSWNVRRSSTTVWWPEFNRLQISLCRLFLSWPNKLTSFLHWGGILGWLARGSLILPRIFLLFVLCNVWKWTSWQRV